MAQHKSPNLSDLVGAKRSGKRGPDPGEGGAPRKPIDMDVMRRAAALCCTAGEIAALLGIGRRTFYGAMKRDPELKTALDQARAHGCATLRRLQWQRAMGGSDTMLIWLGKQLLGQTDHHEDVRSMHPAKRGSG
jgi:hypothetical protein